MSLGPLMLLAAQVRSWPPDNISWLETTVRGGGEVIRCQKLQFSDFPNSVYLTVYSVSPV